MKNCLLVIVMLCFVLFVSAQKKNGTVFMEHETITKTQQMWQAFQNGDEEGFVSFFADSVYRFVNGDMRHIPSKNMTGWVKFWRENYENLKIQDAKPAFPDAIEYKEGGVWVQDWLKFTGIHKKTGIRLDLHYHNLYSFNDEGKISSIHLYFNNNIFEEIRNSSRKIENGKVYINHPYIVTVRKLINAYLDEDFEAMESLYSSNAVFSNSAMKLNEFQTLEERKEVVQQSFGEYDKVKIDQVGYPDCIYYAKNDAYVVYSWWNVTRWKGDKKIEYPVMLSHDFDEDGKIARELVYFSTNHME